MGRLQVGHRRGPRPCPGRHRVVVGPEGGRRPDLDPRPTATPTCAQPAVSARSRSASCRSAGRITERVREPNAIRSSAYNVDYAYRDRRACFEGQLTWLNTVERGAEYRSGDAMGCTGVWFSGRWRTQPALQYIARLDDYLRTRVWTQPRLRTRRHQSARPRPRRRRPTTAAPTTTVAPTTTTTTTTATHHNRGTTDPTTTDHGTHHNRGTNDPPTTTTRPPTDTPRHQRPRCRGVRSWRRSPATPASSVSATVCSIATPTSKAKARASGTWTGDHDLNCGLPVTQRTLTKSNRDAAFYNCRDHLMTSLGHVDSYSIAWFTPNQTFNGQTKVSWDVNVTDLLSRQWYEVMIVRRQRPRRHLHRLAALRCAALPQRRRDRRQRPLQRGQGDHQRAPHATRRGSRSAATTRSTPKACASKEIRRPWSVTDNRNGTITVNFNGRHGRFRDRSPPATGRSCSSTTTTPPTRTGTPSDTPGTGTTSSFRNQHVWSGSRVHRRYRRGTLDPCLTPFRSRRPRSPLPTCAAHTATRAGALSPTCAADPAARAGALPPARPADPGTDPDALSADAGAVTSDPGSDARTGAADPPAPTADPVGVSEPGIDPTRRSAGSDQPASTIVQ